MQKISDIFKRILYIVGVAAQGLIIINSIVNILNRLINGGAAIAPFSLTALFVPCDRYIESGNFAEIIVLLLFIAISIVFYIFASRDLLNRKNRNSAFIILNTYWLILSDSLIIMFMDPYELEILMSDADFISPILKFIPSFLLLLLLFCKILDQQNLRRKEPDPAKEEFLPEKFQTRSISYRQIKRTAMGTPVIATVCFFALPLCMVLKRLACC